MTMTSGTRSRIDSDADIETRVFQRPPPFALDRAMVLQIMRELEPHMRERPGARPLRPSVVAEPNVFLTPRLATDPPPPWARSWTRPLAATAIRAGAVRPRVVRQRSLLPWVTGVMTFFLAFGILQDPVLRQQTASDIQSAAVATQSSAIRLWRFVSRIRT